MVNYRLLKLKKTLPIYNPANGQIYAQAPDSNEEDVIKAVDAATL
ncbi:MAG: hypothetical protein R2766_01385 [Saprospiraceae bacterium]